MKEQSGKRRRPVVVFLVAAALAVCVALLSGASAHAAPEDLLLEKRRIPDPQFGGAAAATVTVPRGWNFEGKVDWNFRSMSQPALISFTVKSPADDAWLTFAGPHIVSACAMQSPSGAEIARRMGRVFAAPPRLPMCWTRLWLRGRAGSIGTAAKFVSNCVTFAAGFVGL